MTRLPVLEAGLTPAVTAALATPGPGGVVVLSHPDPVERELIADRVAALNAAAVVDCRPVAPPRLLGGLAAGLDAALGAPASPANALARATTLRGLDERLSRSLLESWLYPPPLEPVVLLRSPLDDKLLGREDLLDLSGLAVATRTRWVVVGEAHRVNDPPAGVSRLSVGRLRRPAALEALHAAEAAGELPAGAAAGVLRRAFGRADLATGSVVLGFAVAATRAGPRP